MKRLVLAVAATLALAGVGAGRDPSLSYRCNPEASTNCAAWYRVPVKLDVGL